MNSARDSAADDVLMQAAHWFVLLASGDASDADRALWQRWHAADPAHERAWARVQAISAPFTAVPRKHKSAALGALTTREPARRRRNSLLSFFIAGLLGIAGWQGYQFSDFSADAITQIGEQRELQLADGSRLLLDTNTVIDIEFDDTERLLRVRRGRVFIETGHHAEFAPKTFVVATAHARVTALGTQFTVEQQSQHTRVAVLKDRVAVRSQSSDGLIIEEGNSALVDHKGNVTRADVRRNDSAWHRGMLIADDMPLVDFLAQLARYREGELLCDASVATLRISGAFPLRDTSQVLAALTETLPLRIEQHEGGAVTMRAK